MQNIKTITAETEQGRIAITEVMQHSYTSDIDIVPPQWAFVRIVDDVPVSFILIDPERYMEFHGGDIRYAFVEDVATREDRRMEGHFRGIIEYAFSKLRDAGIPIVILHGDYRLYRRFGFDVFTHHCAVFATPELIERKLGTQISDEARQLIVIEDRDYLQNDLLLITEVKAKNFTEYKSALQVSAVIARECGKSRIIFEYPFAPSHGSRYPIYPSFEDSFTELARSCCCEIHIQGDDPESCTTSHADWIKVLDSAGFVKEVLAQLEKVCNSFPEGIICFDTDAGYVMIESFRDKLTVSGKIGQDSEMIELSSSALAQLVTGYQSIEVICAIHNVQISSQALRLLEVLFPHQWRFSRNENWVYGS
jgi:hypothetical protein